MTKNPLFLRLVNTVNLRPVVALLALLLQACAHTPPIRDASGEVAPESIAAMEEVEINGTKHLLLLRGQSTELPVLLVVHGGLGTPYTPIAHTFQRAWERHFLVVHVEQRGSGKLYCETEPERITTAQLLDDTRAVAQYLNQRFHRRVVLLGHSWGAYLGLRTVAAHPDLFSAYVGVGQTIGILEDDRASHAWALSEARRRNDAEALADLKRIGEPPYRDIHEAYAVKYGLIDRYGGMLGVPGGLDFMPSAIMGAPEYSLFDVVDYLRGMSHYEEHLLGNGRDEVWKLTVRDIDELAVPAFFVNGENDRATPADVVASYARTLKAPHVELIRIPGAAHFPFIERSDTFADLLVTRVLPYAERSASGVRAN